MTQFIFTEHCLARMQQRGVTREMVELAFRYGQRIWAKDSLYFFLGRRQVRPLGRMGDKLEGLVVVIESKTREVKTVFKNRRWTKKIRHKK